MNNDCLTFLVIPTDLHIVNNKFYYQLFVN
jgi:hypothetical protein